MQSAARASGKVLPALILGLGHPRQNAFLSSLGRAGIPVHAAYTEKNALRFSRHLKSFQLLSRNPDEQLLQIERFGRETGGFLLPTNDDYVALVSRNRERLARHFVIPVPEWEIVWPLLERASAYALAQSVGIKVPNYWCPGTESELEEVVAGLDPARSDYVLKTRSVLSVPADEEKVRQSKPAPRNRPDMLAACRDMKQRTGDYPLIQEVVPGTADQSIGATLVVGPRGDVLLAYCVRRLRLARYRLDSGYVHPYELGSVLWCETTHDAEAVEAARALVKASGYTGLITVEFRRDPRDNALYLTKIEQRSIRATSLSRVIGMDIPTTLYAAFTGGSPRPASDYPDGVGWVWIEAYAADLVYRNNRRELLHALRGFHGVRAFGEDLLDPVPLLVGAARLVMREVKRPVRALAGWQGPRSSVPAE